MSGNIRIARIAAATIFSQVDCEMIMLELFKAFTEDQVGFNTAGTNPRLLLIFFYDETLIEQVRRMLYEFGWNLKEESFYL